MAHGRYYSPRISRFLVSVLYHEAGFPTIHRIRARSIFERVRAALASKNLITKAELFSRLATDVSKTKNPPFDLPRTTSSPPLEIGSLIALKKDCWHTKLVSSLDRTQR